MNKRDNFLVKSFFVIGGGTVLNMAIALLTTPIITRMVSPESYGQLSVFLVYSNIALNVFCVGLDQAFVRFYYDHNSIDYRRNLLRKCVHLPVSITILSSLVGYVLMKSGLISWEFPDSLQRYFLSIYVPL